MENVYEKLRKMLDKLASGYPRTERGIELKILRQMFPEQEAELFLHLTPMLEKPEDVAQRLLRNPSEISIKLETMAQKGLLFRYRTQDSIRYAILPFVMGFIDQFEHPLTKQIAKDVKDYFDSDLGATIMAFSHPQMRTIPIDTELVQEWPIMPYEDLERVFDEEKKIALLKCICRTHGRLNENGCDKPLETCFHLGSQADYTVENGRGRYVNSEEAKNIVKHNIEQYGFVIQKSAGQKSQAICMCCGDCCLYLQSLKLQPKPAEAAKSNYFADINKDDCTGCEDCLERCQMDAITLNNNIAVIDYDRCIGCGSCIYGCSLDVIRLEKKPENQLYIPPANAMEALSDIAAERGKV